MIIERVYTDGLAQVAWIVGDVETGQAAVIDPRRDPQIYVDRAAQHGLSIIATLETHVHADFVSGVLELQRLTGAEIYASRLGESEFDHSPLDDNDEVSFGSFSLRAFATPGHTPEHLSFLLFTESDPDTPAGVFTGDALFVGEVGRPDLLGEEETESLVRQLYNTVFERFSRLPDNLVVYPGHGAGSACGRNIGSEPTTTIGQEKLGNYAFKPRSLDEFRDAVMTDLPPAPAYYPVLKRINKAGAEPLTSVRVGGPVDVQTFADAINGDAEVIDTRSPDTFADGHIPGTVSIGAGDSFVNWAGWLAPYDRPIYLVVESPDHYQELVTDLTRIGLDWIGGYLDGGIDAWRESGRPLEHYPAISVHELRERLTESDDLTLVDVRAPSEWRSGHIPGSRHAYVGNIVTGDDSLPSNGTLAFICTSGYRSNVATSVARSRGYDSVVNVRGGMDAWTSAGYPIETG